MSWFARRSQNSLAFLFSLLAPQRATRMGEEFGKSWMHLLERREKQQGEEEREVRPLRPPFGADQLPAASSCSGWPSFLVSNFPVLDFTILLCRCNRSAFLSCFLLAPGQLCLQLAEWNPRS